jgi:di/tricarboxylate transporter
VDDTLTGDDDLIEVWLTLLILGAAMFLFFTERLRVDVVALGVVVALAASGILTIEQAIAGFSSTTVISIAALFVVGGAVFQTGLAAMIGDRILRIAGQKEGRLLAVLMIAVALMSSFISSTGVVALMLPAVVSLAARAKMPVSRLLMPLAFSALVGGATTLIGTPPNIIASDTLRAAGYAPFDFFSFTPVGLLLILIGVGYMLTIGRRLQVDRQPVTHGQKMETPSELFALYRLPDNLHRVRVRELSPLVGQRLGDLHLNHDFGVTILSVTRADANGNGRAGRIERPDADYRIAVDDVLLVQGESSAVGRAGAAHNLAIIANDPVREGDIITNEVGIAEVLLRPRSSLLGKSLTDLRFGSVYKVTVINLHRPGTDDAAIDLRTVPLKFGDVLLVQGRWRDIFALKRLRHDFIVMGEPEAVEMGAFARTSRAGLTLLIMALMVLAIVLNIVSLTLGAMIAAGALVLTGCVTPDEAYESIDWKSLILIAGMLPMSTALVKVGVVESVATWFISALGGFGPLAVMAGVFLLTVAFTQVLSNTVTMVLVAPVALATAQSLGVQPGAFLMGAAVAASLAFASPVASPVNTLVMSAGNYRFSDYFRVGAPLIVLSLLLVLLVLPVLLPL